MFYWKWKRQYMYMKNNNVVASFSFLKAFQPFQTFVASWSQTPGHLFTAFWLRSPRANPSTKASACCPQGRRCTMTTQAPHHRQKGKLQEKLPQAFIQIEWMENDYRNLIFSKSLQHICKIQSSAFSRAALWLFSLKFLRMPPSWTPLC